MFSASSSSCFWAWKLGVLRRWGPTVGVYSLRFPSQAPLRIVFE
jgi:hypothetical protein